MSTTHGAIAQMAGLRALARRVAELNPDAGEIGPGMLASLVAEARGLVDRGTEPPVPVPPRPSLQPTRRQAVSVAKRDLADAIALALSLDEYTHLRVVAAAPCWDDERVVRVQLRIRHRDTAEEGELVELDVHSREVVE